MLILIMRTLLLPRTMHMTTTIEDDCEFECMNWQELIRMNGVVMQVLIQRGYYSYRCFYFCNDVKGKECKNYSNNKINN